MEQQFRMEILGPEEWEYFNPTRRTQKKYPAAHLIPISVLAKRWVRLMRDPENWGLRIVPEIPSELQLSKIGGRPHFYGIRICGGSTARQAFNTMERVTRHLVTTVEEKMDELKEDSQPQYEHRPSP